MLWLTDILELFFLKRFSQENCIKKAVFQSREGQNNFRPLFGWHKFKYILQDFILKYSNFLWEIYNKSSYLKANTYLTEKSQKKQHITVLIIVGSNT
ncbi:hypothetical protein NUACC21_43360 [Scytonema sp. NUACC21]